MSESENEPENVEIHTEKMSSSNGGNPTTETVQITEIETKPKKVKKPRSDAQKKAFEKAVATRRANQKRQADARKAKKEVKPQVADRSSDDEEEVVVRRSSRSKKKKPRRRIVYEDSSSSEEETVAVVKRRKKKKPEVLYESDIEEADEPAPAPAPAPVYVPRMPQFQLV